ncbi:unnamed protein product [Adineta ricciae]|uniref:Bulb-type lectin domain-containing protein n=1 Tax=Adineta ricciae TaxID=249248 RepID=A0A815MN63_ADIRI|nr:unnamed protein product [Adineta ricciae]
MKPANVDHTNAKNFPSSGNDTIESSNGRVPQTWINRKRAIWVLCSIIAAGLIVATIVVPLKLPKTKTKKTISQQITTKALSTSTTRTIVLPIKPGAPSSACTSEVHRSFFDNEFICSPSSQTFAAGLLEGQFGVYRTDGYGNVTSSSIWLGKQKSKLGSELKLQLDGHLVVYGKGKAIWASGTENGGRGSPFCLEIADTGNLQWIDSEKTVLWQTNTAIG